MRGSAPAIRVQRSTSGECDLEIAGDWASGGEIIDGNLDLDIPDDDFDYDEYITREFDKDGHVRETPRLHPAWVITALAIITAILILIASGLW